MPRPPKPLNPYASWSALFGATVQKLRVHLRLSQDELGDRTGPFSRSTVSAIERAILRPDRKFMEGCERELGAGGMLRAMFPFVNDEWDQWDTRGGVPQLVPISPAELVSSPAELADIAGVEVAASRASDALSVARQAEASSIGSGTLESLEQAVDRLCRDYPTASPFVLIPRVQRRLRDVEGLLNGRLTLRQHRHMLVAGGWLATLLACLQFDAGDRAGAEETRDAAFQFAKEGEHQEILAWTYELLAWFSLVDRRFHDTVDFARTGLELTRGTSAAVQLAVQEAKGWSRLGDRGEAEDALRRAGTALARLPVPSHPEHHFVFDANKLSFYASTCYVWLGETERAEEHAREVVEQCLAIPGVVRWPMRLAETRVDLGLIAAQRGQLDEACHLGVQALNSERKSGGTLGRVAELDGVLMQDHPDEPDARELHEQYVAARRSLAEGAAT
jgi:transcriptional regulator with XRE-family HTH domain